jgi:hypothetical protein
MHLQAVIERDMRRTLRRSILRRSMEGVPGTETPFSG